MKLQAIFTSDCRNKRLQCYGWWKKFLWSTSKNDLRIYDNIRKFATGQLDDNWLVVYYFIEYYTFYKLIATDVIKQQKLDPDSKAIQQIYFIGDLEQDGDAQMFFIIEEAKELF